MKWNILWLCLSALLVVHVCFCANHFDQEILTENIVQADKEHNQGAMPIEINGNDQMIFEQETKKQLSNHPILEYCRSCTQYLDPNDTRNVLVLLKCGHTFHFQCATQIYYSYAKRCLHCYKVLDNDYEKLLAGKQKDALEIMLDSSSEDAATLLQSFQAFKLLQIDPVSIMLTKVIKDRNVKAYDLFNDKIPNFDNLIIDILRTALEKEDLQTVLNLFSIGRISIRIFQQSIISVRDNLLMKRTLFYRTHQAKLGISDKNWIRLLKQFKKIVWDLELLLLPDNCTNPILQSDSGNIILYEKACVAYNPSLKLYNVVIDYKLAAAFDDYRIKIASGKIAECQTAVLKQIANSYNLYWHNPIFTAISRDDLTALQILHKNEGNLSLLHTSGLRPIHYAAMNSANKCLKYLIAHVPKQDLSIPGPFGFTPSYLAFLIGNETGRKLLWIADSSTYDFSLSYENEVVQAAQSSNFIEFIAGMHSAKNDIETSIPRFFTEAMRSNQNVFISQYIADNTHDSNWLEIYFKIAVFANNTYYAKKLMKMGVNPFIVHKKAGKEYFIVDFTNNEKFKQFISEIWDRQLILSAKDNPGCSNMLHIAAIKKNDWIIDMLNLNKEEFAALCVPNYCGNSPIDIARKKYSAAAMMKMFDLTPTDLQHKFYSEKAEDIIKLIIDSYCQIERNEAHLSYLLNVYLAQRGIRRVKQFSFIKGESIMEFLYRELPDSLYNDIAAYKDYITANNFATSVGITPKEF